MKKILIIVTSILLVIAIAILIRLNIKELPEEEPIITLTFNEAQLTTDSIENEEVDEFIKQQEEKIIDEVSIEYSLEDLVLESHIIEDSDDSYTLSFTGTFSYFDTMIFENDELEISEYIYNSGENNNITFTYEESINYDFSDINYFEIGTFNNDTTGDEFNLAANPSSYSSVVNKNRRLEKGYEPDNLTSITVSSQHSGNNNLIRSDILPSIEQLFSDASSEGIRLTITSAYRSYSTQEGLFNNYANQYGYEKAATFSAFAGASEHQTGLVVDIGSLDNMSTNFSDSFGETNAGKWLASNAHTYGFILRYPKGKQDITTYKYEPWHFRYVGVDLATYLHENSLTLEEFFNLD